MQKSVSLLLSAIFCFSLSATNQAEVLKKLVEKESELGQKKEKYEDSSLVYNLYDSSANGLRGAAFAGVATPCSLGFYVPYSIIRLVDLLFKKSIVCLSSAEQFAGKSREELEKETALRELTNRSAKAAISTGMLVALYLFSR